MKLGNYPLSRSRDIVVKEVAGEVLIYDLLKDKAFCLNQTSAMVWRACDGTQSVSNIANALSLELKAPVSDDIVWFALNQFKHDDLLAESDDLVTPFDGLTRREVVRRIGLASMVTLPFVAGLVAPTALHAQSLCLAAGAVTTGTFPFGGGEDSNTCLNTLRARCCSGLAAIGSSCNCLNNPVPNTCVGSVTCACLAPGAVTTGTFPFGGGNDSNTCLSTLKARCCSGQAAAGSSCSCIGNPLPNTCVGTATCS